VTAPATRCGTRVPDALVKAVQRNCDIADARHGRDAALCSYLLEMREYFCWEHGLPLEAAPNAQSLGRWVGEREALWATLEETDFAPLPVAGAQVDPFDSVAVNRALGDAGLVYSGGVGRFHRPHFFLAERARAERRDGLEVLVSGCELARDLAGGLGALQGSTIHVRADAVRRWLWQRIELWTARPLEGPLRAALDGFGYRPGDTAAFERVNAAQVEAVILHELGEARAGAALGAEWESMLASFERAPAELLARAVRDNLADCLSTVRALVERCDTPAIHLWFASFEGLRRELFPRLVAGYEAWRREGERAALRNAAAAGAAHWDAVARRLLALGGDERAIEALYRDRHSAAL
jgi:hypothetical protein